jgi:hypothetical protein
MILRLTTKFHETGSIYEESGRWIVLRGQFHVGPPDYRFHSACTISTIWAGIAFSSCVSPSTREVLRQTVESFLHSGDGDRDGAFRDTWRTTGQEDLAGALVIQCKFTSKRDYVIRTADLSDELEKAQKLVAKGHCDSYVLMTNAGLTGPRAAEIRALYHAAGVERVATFGSTWISQQIRENKRLRMLVPRVSGLGDLIAPRDPGARVTRRYLDGSLLATTFETADGANCKQMEQRKLK